MGQQRQHPAMPPRCSLKQLKDQGEPRSLCYVPSQFYQLALENHLIIKLLLLPFFIAYYKQILVKMSSVGQ